MSVVHRGGNRFALASFGHASPYLVIAIGVLCVATLPVLHVAANRLVVGTPVMATAVLGGRGWLLAATCLLGTIGAVASGSRLPALATLSSTLILFAAGLGAAASDLVAGQPPAVRARLASGAWIGLLLLTFGIAWTVGQTRLRGAGGLTLTGLVASIAMLFDCGAFDGLSLLVEYRARAETVHAAFVQHLVLATTAIVLAAIVSALLYAWRPGRGVAEILVNGIQVVPAVALLGSLVALVSALLAAEPGLRAIGLSALGSPPAILAIAAYLLLPLYLGLRAALRAADPAVIDAATALGLNRSQILLRLRLPIGAPLLIGALRVACVQGVGLATLGALVGAGGLGAIVFDGMAQFAPDLILLGALPVIGLSLIIERTLSAVEGHVRSRWTA